MGKGHQKRPIYKRPVLYFKILMAAVIFWLLARNSQLRLDLLATIILKPWSTLVIVLLCYLMVVVHAWRWYRFNIVQGIPLPFFRTLMPTYLGVAFNTVLPGSVGGDLVRLYYVLRRFPQQKSNAAIAILVDRISGLLGIFIIACAISPYYLAIFQQDSALYYLLVVSVSVCVGILVLFVGLLVLLSERVGLANILMRKLAGTRWIPLLSVLEALNCYRNAKLVILESLVISMVTQFLLLVVVAMLGSMMGLPTLSLYDYMLALVIGQVANLVPLTPGGVGMGEAAFANIILIVHPGTTAAYATVFFGLRLLSTLAYLPGVFIGIFGFHLLDKKLEPHTVDVNA